MGPFHKEFPGLLLQVRPCNHDIFDTNLHPVVYLLKSHSEWSRLCGRWFGADRAWRAVCPGLCSIINVSASSTIMLCVVVVVVVIIMIMSRSLSTKPLKEDRFGSAEDFRVL